MIAFLESEHSIQAVSSAPARCAHVQLVVRSEKGANQLFELLVDLDQGKVVKNEYLEGKHSYIDAAYMKQVEAACMTDERVQAEIKALDLPVGSTVCVEPWAYATDGMNDMSERISMVRTIRALSNYPCRILKPDWTLSAGFICAWWITRMPTTTLIRSIYVPKCRRSSSSPRSTISRVQQTKVFIANRVHTIIARFSHLQPQNIIQA